MFDDVLIDGRHHLHLDRRDNANVEARGAGAAEVEERIVFVQRAAACFGCLVRVVYVSSVLIVRFACGAVVPFGSGYAVRALRPNELLASMSSEVCGRVSDPAG